MPRRSLCALALCAFIGCASGPKPVPVTGTVLKGGKPFAFSAQGMPPGDPGFRLGFSAFGAGGTMGDSFFAIYSPSDGTFKVAGPQGKGIPPGKYRISVSKGAMGKPDEFKDAFSRDKSPLNVEIPAAASVDLEVDLDKQTATVK